MFVWFVATQSFILNYISDRLRSHHAEVFGRHAGMRLKAHTHFRSLCTWGVSLSLLGHGTYCTYVVSSRHRINYINIQLVFFLYYIKKKLFRTLNIVSDYYYISMTGKLSRSPSRSSIQTIRHPLRS